MIILGSVVGLTASSLSHSSKVGFTPRGGTVNLMNLNRTAADQAGNMSRRTADIAPSNRRHTGNGPECRGTTPRAQHDSSSTGQTLRDSSQRSANQNSCGNDSRHDNLPEEQDIENGSGGRERSEKVPAYSGGESRQGIVYSKTTEKPQEHHS